MQAGQPAGRLQPGGGATRLTEPHTRDFFEEEPVAILVRTDDRPVEMGRAEAVPGQDLLISPDLTQRLVKESGLHPTGGLVEVFQPQVLEQEPQDGSLLELDLEVDEMEAGPLGVRTAFQPDDPPEIRMMAVEQILERGPQIRAGSRSVRVG